MRDRNFARQATVFPCYHLYLSIPDMPVKVLFGHIKRAQDQVRQPKRFEGVNRRFRVLTGRRALGKEDHVGGDCCVFSGMGTCLRGVLGTGAQA